MFKKSLLILTTWIIFFTLNNVAFATPLPDGLELKYDDGSDDGAFWLLPGQIAAVRMTPPSPPSGTHKLATARYYLYDGEAKVMVFYDDEGRPGSDLVGGLTIDYEGEPGWYDVDLQSWDIRVEGDFYVGIQGIDAVNRCGLGHDFLEGGNGRAWDYTLESGWMENPAYTYFIRSVILTVPGVEEELAPEVMTILQCSPNPFSQSTAISYALPQAGRVTLSIWDASGRRVRTLVDECQAQGSRSIVWDGTDDAGNLLPTGVYFLKLDTNHSTLTRKVVLVR